MTCCNVIAPTVNNPFLHNNIVSDLQMALQPVGFFSYVYPLVQVMEINMNDRRGNVPVIFGQDANLPNNYIQMFPDGNKKGIAFFEIPSGEYPLRRGTKDGDLIDIIVRIVVTANLKNITPASTYDYTDELISRVYKALESSSLNQDINSITIVTAKERIFDKYTYEFNELQSLAYPMTGFAIDLGMTVDYNFECTAPDEFTDTERITEDGCERITEESDLREIE